MGYSDIGAFGSEIPTPHMDAVVRDGRVLSSFYAAPACAPTRGMLMWGADSHRVGLAQLEVNTVNLINDRNAPVAAMCVVDGVCRLRGGRPVPGAAKRLSSVLSGHSAERALEGSSTGFCLVGLPTS